jgi:Na+:H+ antiporter, NhaA family
MIRRRIIPFFNEFLKTEQSSGIILIVCTVLSLLLSNSIFSEQYHHFWETKIGFDFGAIKLRESIELWINDGLMVIFFLVVGMEIKRELLEGELSSFKKAALPISAALGGMIVPAFFYSLVNNHTETAGGWGIPMATDIAFALGVLSLLGNRVPLSLKVFLTALAVVDDLGAILVIAVFYSSNIVWLNLGLALLCFALLHTLNYIGVRKLSPYILIGLIMWYLMLKSGVHATISGVLLATAIPLKRIDGYSPLVVLEKELHSFSAYIIMPLFALANTAIIFHLSPEEVFGTPLSTGIIVGLLFGKVVGILSFSYGAKALKIAHFPSGTTLKKIIGVGFLGGIGFTMSIFISVLAFKDPNYKDMAKISVLAASLISGIIGFFILKREE